MPIDQSQWQLVTLGDLVQEITVHERDPQGQGLERYVGLDHLDPYDSRVKRWGLISEGVTFTKVFRAGQILFGKRRVYQKKMGVPDFDGLCSGDIIVLDTKSDRLSREFLALVVQTEAFFAHAEKTSSGSLSPRTKFRELAKYEFLLPPPEQQRELVELMQGFEKAIEAGDHAIEAGSVFIDAFLFKKLTPVEGEEWKVGTVGDFLTLQRGFDITNKQIVDGEIPVVSSSGITAYHSVAMVSGPGVVIGRKGSLGNVYFIMTDFWPHDTSLWVKDFKGNLPEFVALVLKFLKLERLDASTACPTLNRNVVHPLPVAFPGKDLQQKIVDDISQANSFHEQQMGHLASLKNLRFSILNTALSPSARAEAATEVTT